jgi:hypothetical protein
MKQLVPFISSYQLFRGDNLGGEVTNDFLGTALEITFAIYIFKV